MGERDDRRAVKGGVSRKAGKCLGKDYSEFDVPLEKGVAI